MLFFCTIAAADIAGLRAVIVDAKNEARTERDNGYRRCGRGNTGGGERFSGWYDFARPQVRNDEVGMRK